MIINPQQFITEIPDLHPLSNDYINFWRTSKQRCIEGHWLGGYYMPPGLYFYTNFGTILLNKKRSNVKSIGRPWLRDLEWMFFRAWMEARGFSGFAQDEEYSGNFLLLDPDISDEFLQKYYPSTINSLNQRKEFLHPRTLLEMQHSYHKGAPLYENEAYNILMLGSRDTGKALPSYTEIPTPSGFKQLKDLSVGDEVFSLDGQPTKILGIYPQGLQKTYLITLKDGRKIEASEDHLWTVIEQSRRKLTLSTKEIVNRGYLFPHKKSGKSYKYSLPEIRPVEYPKISLPLAPYVLGAFLGDGDMKHSTPRLSTNDIEILEKVIKLLPGSKYKRDFTTNNYSISFNKEVYKDYGVENLLTNPLTHIFRNLNLNVGCKEKFIPEEYKFSSIEDRLELVRGLLDTDGSITQKGAIEFSNTNKRLVLDLLEILRSLGIYVTLGESTNNRGILYYRLYIRTELSIFSLKRKLERIKTRIRKNNASIISIEEVEPQESICIRVDHPSSLFLATKDYIPTHNTYMVGVGIVLHQWLFNGLTSLTEDISDRGIADITVGAELAHYSNNMLTKTKFALENLPGSKTVNGRRYPSPFDQQYRGSWGAGSSIVAEYKSRQEGGWEIRGTRAAIRHRTFRDNPFAEQGTRPITIVVEEAGHCSNLQDIFTNTKDNLRNGLRKTGTLMMLGTGGDMEAGTLDASRMMYEPEAYDILAFPDIWEHKGNIGFFIPAYLALNEYKDEKGFSMIEEARAALLKARQKAKTSASGGSEVLQKEIQYRPIVPSEMFLTKSANIFPVIEARRRLSELQSNNLYELLEKKVNLFFDPSSPYNGINYEIDFNLTPINRFPWTSDDVEGATIIYDFPYLEDGRVPQDAYIIGCDPFRDNTGTEGSFAAIYVMKTNKYPSTVGHNEIVATYVGRPYEGVNKVNEILYKLSLFYGNAKIYFENAVGNVKDYFEKIKRLDLLAKQPVNVLNRKASFNTTESVIYGYPMSNEKIKWEALQYVRSWLLQERENNVRNIDVIPDRFLLQQLISFNLDGNFDGVMGLIGCVIGLEEIYISSKRRAEAESFSSSVDIEFDKLLVNNKRLFYKIDEKFSQTTPIVSREDQKWLSMM